MDTEQILFQQPPKVLTVFVADTADTIPPTIRAMVTKSEIGRSISSMEQSRFDCVSARHQHETASQPDIWSENKPTVAKK